MWILFSSVAWVCYRAKGFEDCENVVELLIDDKADANEILTEKNVTILQLAAQMGKYFRRILWKKGAFENESSPFVNLENERTVELLVAAGANVTAKSASGLTALHRACYLREFY